MRSIGAFCISTWLAAAVLVLGRHSVPMIALSGVIVFAGLDLFRPSPDDQ
jgi:MFS superfamily sulfate permease-like transporter